MRAKYDPDKTNVRLERNEVIMITRALDALKYSAESETMDGEQLLLLGALHMGFRSMLQDMCSPRAEKRCAEHNHAEALEDILRTEAASVELME